MGNTTLLTNIEASDYLPAILRSPPFGQSTVDIYNTNIGEQSVENWQHLNRFESQCTMKNTHVLFCGGPVRTLDWIPEVASDDYQYLAVSCEAKDESPFLLHSNASKSCIQIWQMDIKNSTQHCRYNVAFDNGPIRSLAFCPSGGFDTATNRLAIVAVSTVSGDIHLLALPNPSEEEIPMGATVRIVPSLVLKTGSKAGQVTRIVWSKVLCI